MTRKMAERALMPESYVLFTFAVSALVCAAMVSAEPSMSDASRGFAPEAARAEVQIPLFRINAGGALVVALDEGPDWSADTLSEPSAYLATGGDFTNAFPVLELEPVVPLSTPSAIFESERWDSPGGPEMRWQFPVAHGTPVSVRLYLMNGFAGTSGPGERVFKVEIDGESVFGEIDLAAEAGQQIATMRTYETISDGLIDIEFIRIIDNPLVNGIEIVQVGTQPGVLSALPTNLDFGKVLVDSFQILPIQLRNQGANDEPLITVEAVELSNPAYVISLVEGASISPGVALETQVTFAPGSVGAANGAVNIFHTGANSPLTISLAGEGVDEEPLPPIAFLAQTITARQLPTQLEFGPDERLYVAELDGLIYAYTIERNDDTGNYSIIATEVIDLIQTIPNHNEDGTPHPSSLRSVTGMIAAGTADNPVLYVSSSDPRIDDVLADTNSGMVSRLTWTGSEWDKLDLVRSLPRSAHDHFANGMALDQQNSILYLAQGGHTNMGAPSFSFGYLPEYALSGAILSIDLNMIGEQTYDIPTLKGEVFGGRSGDNQAMMVLDGPVQVHSPGYRNPYDVLLTSAGRLYTFDNDSNAGWGGPPVGEGPGGTCTNESNDLDSATHGDNFHWISGPGYYGGHPNPTRANRSNTFDGLSPIPEGSENPVECQFLIPAVEDGAIALHGASTNGLAEYTASNFSGQMNGSIVVTTWDGKVLRLRLNSAGDEVIEQKDLLTNLSGPLGIDALGDEGPFPGTIWIGEFFNGKISVFEPQDFSDCDPGSLDLTATSPNGYTYGDLIDNGLDPCNPAQIPPDFDGDFVSDLNDPDIDGDGIANTLDRFDFDADNGRGTTLPHRLSWGGDEVGLLGGMASYNAPGFTGLMTHPESPLSVFNQFNAERLIPGGAAGIFTVEEVTSGDARLNTQENAFHFGVDVDGASGIFTAQTRMMVPFAGESPQDDQSMGLVIGSGDQDNYIKLVTNANGGDGGVRVTTEIQGVVDTQQAHASILGADYVELFLVVEPAASTVEASYVIVRDGLREPRRLVAEPVLMPAGWLSDPTNGLAIGIISTSSGAGSFSASWGFVEVYEGAGEPFPVPGEGQLDAVPSALAFPNTPVGEAVVEVLTLSNSGETALEISDALISGDPVFGADIALPQILQPGATLDLSGSFMPVAEGVAEAALILSHDGANNPLQVSMTGAGVETASVPVPDRVEVDFGGVSVGSVSEPEAVTMTNASAAPVALGSLDIGGEHGGDFILDQTADGCSGMELQPGQSCSFVVRFQPTRTGLRDAQLDVPSGPGNATISLHGEGQITLDLQIDASPNPAIAGGVLVYNLTLANLAAVPAENVNLEITVPQGAVLLASNGCAQDPVGQPSCSVGRIPANGSSEVVVSVVISSSALDAQIMGVRADADGLDEAIAAQITTPVAFVADLALVMTGAAETVDAQTMSVTYAILVSNTGPSDAVAAQVRTDLASALSTVEWICETDVAARCSAAGQGDIDDLVDLPAGTSLIYRVEALVPRTLLEDGVTSSAEVSSSGSLTDPIPDNNSDLVTVATRLFRDRFEKIEEIERSR